MQSNQFKFAIGLCLLCLGTPFIRAADKPNIVVILSDDLGWGSAGCYGAPESLPTANIDRIAREGRRFTNAYAPGSVCSPTRYGLMTGRYFWRTSVQDGGVLAGNAPLHIETNRLTLASLCKSQDYQTAAFGKWHLGMGNEPRKRDWSGSLAPGPLEIGFDYFFGIGSNPWSGPHSFIENHELQGAIAGQSVTVNGNRAGSTTSGIVAAWDETKIMQTVTDKMTSWIDEHHAKPFFVYFAPNAVHRPIVPNARFAGNKFGPFGDFVSELDWSVGQLLGTLDRHSLRDNTLLIFTSDNGGVANQAADAVGQSLTAGLKPNGQLRGGKHDVWEGGFREPFVVRWPGHVPAGTVSDQVICLTDLVATVANVLQTPLPDDQAEDSVDVLRAMTETSPGPPLREHVILQSAHVTYAIRMGDWKLIEWIGGPQPTPRNPRVAELTATRLKPKQNQLFNLRDDPSESTDLFAANQAQATLMKTRLDEARNNARTR